MLFYVKKKNMDNFVYLLEFEYTKRLKVHSQAIPTILFLTVCKTAPDSSKLKSPYYLLIATYY